MTYFIKYTGTCMVCTQFTDDLALKFICFLSIFKRIENVMHLISQKSSASTFGQGLFCLPTQQQRDHLNSFQ